MKTGKIKGIFLKDSNKITFDLPISGSDWCQTITITAEGSPDALKYFKDKTISLFKTGVPKKRHNNQKLTEEQVIEIKRIRREKGWGRTRLAKKFKVGKTTIERIINGKSWMILKINNET